jgi:transposase-like protein
MSKQNKTYTKKIKEKAMQLLQQEKQSISQVMAELGVSRATLNRWVHETLLQNPAPSESAAVIKSEQEKQNSSIIQPSEKLTSSEIISPAKTSGLPEINWIHANAEAIVKEAFLGILGREADSAAIQAFSSVLKTNAHISDILIRLLNSQEYLNKSLAMTQFREKIQLATTTLLQHLSGVTIETIGALNANKLANQLIVSMMSRIQPGFEDHITYLNHNIGVSFKYSQFSGLSSPRNLGIIFIPDEPWLQFTLCVADYLYKEHKLETVLVYDKWSPSIAAAQSLSAAIYQIISLRELKTLPKESPFRPKVIVSHSYGWTQETTYLLNTFPEAKLLVYADGFKNEIRLDLEKIRKIEGSIFFGYVPMNQPLNVFTTIGTNTVLEKSNQISAVYQLSAKPKTNPSDYAAVYLRHWGKGAYVFNTEEVVTTMVDTISRYVSTSLPLVIKNPRLAFPELLPQITKTLTELGYTVIGFDTYLTQNGIDKAYQWLPVEYFLGHGLLCDAKAHVVFDSALSYILAAHPQISLETEIIIGADVQKFRAKALSESLEHTKDLDTLLCQKYDGLRIIRHFSRIYANAILAGDLLHCELIENDQDFLFHIKKLKQKSN